MKYEEILAKLNKAEADLESIWEIIHNNKEISSSKLLVYYIEIKLIKSMKENILKDINDNRKVYEKNDIICVIVLFLELLVAGVLVIETNLLIGILTSLIAVYGDKKLLKYIEIKTGYSPLRGDSEKEVIDTVLRVDELSDKCLDIVKMEVKNDTGLTDKCKDNILNDDRFNEEEMVRRRKK